MIYLTTGDPQGIGPEISWKALYKLEKEFQSKNIALMIFHESRPPLKWGWWADCSQSELISIWDLSTDEQRDEFSFSPSYYRESSQNFAGVLAARKIEAACKHLKKFHPNEGKLCTAPIHKQRLIEQAHCRFGAHTEYLQALFHAPKVVMCLKNAHFSVSLLTIHEPISKVPQLLQKMNISDHLSFTMEELQRFRIAHSPFKVLGLNPHAGEGGHLGHEETELLHPVITQLQKQYSSLEGPISADTAFVNIPRGCHFVSCYHDQGLIPIKTLYPHETINITLGLPVLRTSPDHGTADNIAGLDQANSESMECALRECLK